MAIQERAQTTTDAVAAKTLVTEAPSRPTGWWGMVLFITTEGTIFAALIASYFYVRFRSTPDWPLGDIPIPELRLALIMSGILFSSTVPTIMADRAIRRGQVGLCRLSLLITTLLGLTFLSLQGLEYYHKLEEFTVSTNVYGSLFFTITGFHGSHVAVGLLMLTYIQAAAWRGKFGVKQHHQVKIAAMYWHFVDAVWVAILLSLYLSPHF